MSSMADRLELCEAVLDLIEKKRAEKHDPYLGEAIERAIIESQFTDLESDIMQNPGAFEPWLVRRRKQEN